VVLPLWFDPRGAVRAHHIMCLVCGKCFRQLTNTHLRSHDLTTASYTLPPAGLVVLLLLALVPRDQEAAPRATAATASTMPW